MIWLRPWWPKPRLWPRALKRCRLLLMAWRRKADWDDLLDAAADAAKRIKKEVDGEVPRLAKSAAAASVNHPPRSRRGPTNAERNASIARKKADREVALIEAAALVLKAEKEAPDAAARASDTLTGIQKGALRSVGISVQHYWINAVCC